MDFSVRQKRLTDRQHALGLDAFLITHLPNVRYTCGFTGSNGVLLSVGSRRYFFTDGRYTEQARQEMSGAVLVVARGSLLHAAAQRLQSQKVVRVGFESDRMTQAGYAALRKSLPRSIKLVPACGVVDALRMIKDAEELKLIRQAVNMGADLLMPAVEAIRPGVREADVAAEIEYAARRWGAEQMSFETIVAAGKRSALPHGRASSARIPRRGFVILDLGVILAGYCSDMTRTVHAGTVTRADRGIYNAVLEAQEAAIERAGPGVTAGAVDEAARSVLRKAGLERFFVHSTGHGVGLEIHEPPRVGKGQMDVLRPGTVITIEPGVYLAGRGGVRIEDMVAITERGRQVLTPATKELLEL